MHFGIIFTLKAAVIQQTTYYEKIPKYQHIIMAPSLVEIRVGVWCNNGHLMVRHTQSWTYLYPISHTLYKTYACKCNHFHSLH